MIAPTLTSARNFIREFAAATEIKASFDGRLRLTRLADNADAEIAAIDAALALIENAQSAVKERTA